MIAIVIPTYKRIQHLGLLIRSIEEQSIKPEKVTIVYADMEEDDLKKITEESSLPIELLSSEASVCKQRNLGIKNSDSKYIFLCDDDIELPKNYLERLVRFLEESPAYNIATGEEYQLNDKKEWQPVYVKLGHFNLWFNYMFGLSLFTNLEETSYQSNAISKYVSKKLIQQGNHISFGGWPRICKFEYPITESTIYGLGASMIRATHLNQNLYNEQLPQHSIGDNYEVALNINKGKNKIAVLRDIYFKHYKAPSNRVSRLNAYTQRIKELKRVIFNAPYFTIKNRLYFSWSLVGNTIFFLFKREWQLFMATIRVLLSAILDVFNTKKVND